jgi:hypothetical protein
MCSDLTARCMVAGEHEPGVEEPGLPGEHLRAVLPQDPPHPVQQGLPWRPHRWPKIMNL